MIQKRANNRYDVIVIGGGHAGVEAAWAAAHAGGSAVSIALVTMDPTKIGAMSCNPAIGGLAKGQMVREIDALGGLMGLAADATGIQFRMLNRSKGQAVHGPRCQSDKYQYARKVQQLLSTCPNIDIIAGTVDKLFVGPSQQITGIQVAFATQQINQHNQQLGTSFADDRLCLDASSVVLTTGTFMRGLMHTGQKQTAGGRVDEGAAIGISGMLQSLGFELGRLKTGTPPRLAKETIDFDSLEVQPGDDCPVPFSDLTKLDQFPVLPQQPCWITHTNGKIHDLIRANLDRAPMYNGQIKDTAGPRYCPSIEDKVVRFADRSAHLVYLEPESLETNEIYCNGISTSLPGDVQQIMIRNMAGCKHAKILRYGYAVEYDMVWPHQIDSTCMTKLVDGLYLAGQINGTSGYEEAAGQGLIAGLNAIRRAKGLDAVRLRRDQAYIGVMLDDLVIKTPREPYRMFTSRAEHRLLLRADNACDRLTALGKEWGLVDAPRWSAYQQRVAAFGLLNDYIQQQKSGAWLRRQQTTTTDVLSHIQDAGLPTFVCDARIIGSWLADMKYAGYVKRQHKDIQRLAGQEKLVLPADLDFGCITGLRNEAKGVLGKFRPRTLGQATRLAGVTPADAMVLTLALGR